MGLRERLGLTEQRPQTEEERRLERTRVLEVEAREAKGRPIPEHVQLSCGHRSVKALRAGVPRPPVGMCPLCVAEAGQARQGGKRPFVPEDEELVVDAERGRVDSRGVQRWPRDWELRTARWLDSRRQAGEVLPHSEAEQTALSRIEELRRQEAEEERLRALSPEERAERARAINRQQRGLRGGMIGTYQPGPARCGLP